MKKIGLLHNFKSDQVERRQYARLTFTFPVWWLEDGRTDRPVAGIGIEISGGGLQFLLEFEHMAPPTCQIAFEIEGRSMRANVRVIRTDDLLYKGRIWLRHAAKFEGLLATDFDFIVALRAPDPPPLPQPPRAATAVAPRPAAHPAALPEQAAAKMSIAKLDLYNLLPEDIKARIVQKLVDLERVAPVADPNLALVAGHYGGMQPAATGAAPYHRFSFRSKKDGDTGAVVFDSQFLVSDDGAQILFLE